MSNIKSTKHHLSLTFTIVVFIIILSFGLIFFSTKFFRSYSVEKNNFSRIAQLVNNDNLQLKSLVEYQREISRTQRKPSGGNGRLENELLGRGGINFILLDSDKNILGSNVKVQTDDGFLENIIETNVFSKINIESNFFLTKIPFQEQYSLVLFQKIKYTPTDFLGDIMLFLLLTTLLSGLIYVVGKTFVNKAFIPVEDNIEDMKNFVHNAGHELKTPLSVIDSNLQLLTDMKKYDSEMIGENRAEIKKLNSLIDSLIQLTDIDTLKQKEPVNLKEIVEEIENDHGKSILDKSLNFRIRIDENYKVNAHRDYLYIFLSNLVGNAIKYNKNEGKILIALTGNTLTIRDTGIGISSLESKKIWERFYQAESSRSGDGFGIGLSLVKKIGDIYKWSLKLKSEIDKGTTIEVKFK